jgi:toxin ParE2
MRRVVRHPDVARELEAATLWYEERHPGLGVDFLEEYQAVMARILREPERWRRVRGDNRKLNFRRFPYAIVYSATVDVIYIKAVMHLHRRPFYWRHR